MVKRLGKAVSRGADIGDNVIVGAKIADDTIQLADMLEYHTGGSITTTSGLVISHNLGSTPTEIVLTQISSAKIGHLFRGSTNASQAVIGTDVSGIYFDIVCRV